MKLMNCEMKAVISVDHTQLEELIADVYGVEYEIMPMEEVGNSQYNATYTKKVKKAQLNDAEITLIQKLVEDSPIKYSLDTIMKDLCNKGYLVEGEYIIDVSW
jgi:hypothetical protein